ncbi:MAG: hypothetical protein ACREGL_09015 [Alphaproteobacteria bacterium]
MRRLRHRKLSVRRGRFHRGVRVLGGHVRRFTADPENREMARHLVVLGAVYYGLPALQRRMGPPLARHIGHISGRAGNFFTGLFRGGH